MCGISAIFNKSITDENNLSSLIKRMNEIQNHRGPDNEGLYVSENRRVALGHCKLSNIELYIPENQLLFNESDSISLVCDGEIFNYQELKKELLIKGHKFSSNSDCEVLLHLYEEYRYDFLEKIRGMYAFVIYDSNNDIMFCARDRLGEKPLVYAETSRGVVVASEIPAAKQYDDINLELEPLGLLLYLTRGFRHIPEPWTLYSGIKKLRAGHAMIVENGKVKKTWQYWNPSFHKRVVTVEEVTLAFEEAVQLRGMSDIEVGAMLSGGVDSSAIVSYMMEQSNDKIRTYAMGKDRNDDELERARRASELYNTIHKEYYFDGNAMLKNFDELLSIYGEPFMLMPMLSTFELCKHIKEDGIKVVMTGNGADEIFYGYNGNGRLASVSEITHFIPRFLKPTFSLIAKSIHGKNLVKEVLLVLSQEPGYRRSALFTNEALLIMDRIFTKEYLIDNLAEKLNDWVAPWAGSISTLDYIDETNFMGLVAEATHSVIIPGDLPAMAAGVETRAPFLDHKLVELAYQIPYQEKVGQKNNPIMNKLILKKALEHRVPKDILYAEKRGFGYNINEREILLGSWRDCFEESFDILQKQSSVFNPEKILEIKKDYENNPSPSDGLATKLFALGYFLGGRK